MEQILIVSFATTFIAFLLSLGISFPKYDKETERLYITRFTLGSGIALIILYIIIALFI